MKKKIIIWPLIVFVILMFTGCSMLGTIITGSVNGKYPKEYWGTWIRMDTGDTYYITNNEVYEFYYSSKTLVESKITAQSEEVLIMDGKYLLFRKGGKSRDFTMKVSGFESSYNTIMSRAASAGSKVSRKNIDNSGDTETVTIEENGTISFTDAVADSTQNITLDKKNTKSVNVTPQFDGEFMGSFPVVEKGKYGFKTELENKNEYMYGNNYKSNYEIKIIMWNIGDTKCATSVFEISSDDPELVFDAPLKGNFSTIEPGKGKSITYKVSYGLLNEEYKDVPIKIKITDSDTMETWNDYVTLRFYKERVKIYVKSRNFEGSSSARLNGFVIHPDGKSQYFSTNYNNYSRIEVPWSSQTYQIVFSGANSATEMGYSFGLSEDSLSELNGVWDLSDINAYEPNNSQAYAASVDIYSSVKGYLKDGDIDFYKFKFHE